MWKSMLCAAAVLCGLAAPASATNWCMWPHRPNVPPHPCSYGGGVVVGASVGYWWGDSWVWGAWHPWIAGRYYTVVPHWGHHDWKRTRDWR